MVSCIPRSLCKLRCAEIEERQAEGHKMGLESATEVSYG